MVCPFLCLGKSGNLPSSDRSCGFGLIVGGVSFKREPLCTAISSFNDRRRAGSRPMVRFWEGTRGPAPHKSLPPLDPGPLARVKLPLEVTPRVKQGAVRHYTGRREHTDLKIFPRPPVCSPTPALRTRCRLMDFMEEH